MGKFRDGWNKFTTLIGLEPIEDEVNYVDDTEETVTEEVIEEPIRAAAPERQRPSRVYRQERSRERAEKEEEQQSVFSSRKRSTGNLINIADNYRETSNSGVMLKIFHPQSYEDATIIIDNLRSRRPIIINIDEIDVKLAQRILDFVSGAVMALNGNIEKAGRNIYAVTPSNISISVGTNDTADDNIYLRENFN
ncbi:MAG: cell division protein SepF [Clostridiales bacterium]|jgi:cell division inhibitor SepF|nr:cell division protein SepF [Clostridiales bacterium]